MKRGPGKEAKKNLGFQQVLLFNSIIFFITGAAIEFLPRDDRKWMAADVLQITLRIRR